MVLSICVALAANGRNIGQAPRLRQLAAKRDFYGKNRGSKAFVSNAEQKANATFTILT
jgi:hypothetical protein